MTTTAHRWDLVILTDEPQPATQMLKRLVVSQLVTVNSPPLVGEQFNLRWSWFTQTGWACCKVTAVAQTLVLLSGGPHWTIEVVAKLIAATEHQPGDTA